MAIAFARVSIHSRSKGHSAVAASAYRTATKLFDERIGTNYDYSNRREVVFSEIMLPHAAHEKFKNREFLWNEVERVEDRINSQLCKDVVLALPKELNTIQHIELARRFAQLHFVENGLACDVAIHDDKDGNPHAHILTTLRRIEGQQFAKYKARDLNPQFAKGFIVEGDYWHKEWRDFQNDYFQEQELDLSVDLNHLITEKHAGRFRDKTNHYLYEENQLIKVARAELALNDLENLINQISLTNSVFTRRDIERLIFKTLSSEVNTTDYLNLVEKLLTHKDVIHLGANDRGVDCYTTRHQYIAEARLLENVEQLQQRKSHVFNYSGESLINHYHLNEEQAQAFTFITEGEDISVLIGRPGVGKSYLLKPIKDYYEANHCRVLGASLSGKVAKALQAETGIKSSTIASLVYRLNNQILQLTSNDILVIDEAGMVDFANMSYLLEAANKAGSKVVLVGDPDQLKPIHQGEIFRGISERTGYIELAKIRRQQHAGDRQATLELSKGNITTALEHYVNQKAIHFSENELQSQELITNRWFKSLEACDLKEHIMLAFTCKAVLALNERARSILQENSRLPIDEYAYLSQGGERSIKLAAGERVLFRQNNKAFGIRNGDLATITAINATEFTATLDDGEEVTLSRTYKHIDYGYALTVHKAQGMTVDKASVLIDSKYWDRNLSFVAMTRHRKELSLYVDKEQHPDLKALSTTLSRSTTKDNVIDWPLNYAIRAGFDPDKIAGKIVNYIADVGQQIKNKWNYLVDYEAHLRSQQLQTNILERATSREAAKEIAGYLDRRAALNKQISILEKESMKKNVSPSELPLFESIYKQSIERDKRAYSISNKYFEQFEKLTSLSPSIAAIKKDCARYERYLTIKEIAELPAHTQPTEQLTVKAFKVKLKNDYPHLVNLAKQNNKTTIALYKQIDSLQKHHQQKLFDQIKKEYPIMAEYENLVNNRKKIVRFKAEQLDKYLALKIQEIKNNLELSHRLKNELPAFMRTLDTRYKGQNIVR